MSQHLEISLLFCLYSGLTYSTVTPLKTFLLFIFPQRDRRREVFHVQNQCFYCLIVPMYCLIMWSLVKWSPMSLTVNVTGVGIINLINFRLCPQRNYMWVFIFMRIFISHEHMIKSSEENHCKSSPAPSLPVKQSHLESFGDIIESLCWHSQIKTSLSQITAVQYPRVTKHLDRLGRTLSGFLTHRRPLPGTPLATRAEAAGRLRRARQVGTVRLVGHSSLGISAADVALPLPLATGHGALQDMHTQAERGWIFNWRIFKKKRTAVC